MPEIIEETSDAVLSGTDGAIAGTNRVSEVFIGSGIEPTEDQQHTQTSMDRALAKIRERNGGAPAPQVRKPARAAAPAPEVTDEPVVDAPADEEPAAGEDTPAADPPADEPAPEPEVHPDLLAERAGHELTKTELAQLRQQLQEARSGRVPKDDRVAYITDPLAYIRNHIAKVLGVKPDHEIFTSDAAKGRVGELDFIHRALTIGQIGDSALPDDRRNQHAREQSDRRWGLDQLSQAAERETEATTQQRAAAVKHLATFYKGQEKSHPALAYAAADQDRPAEEIVGDVYFAAVHQGLIDLNWGHAKQASEALRLANRYYANRADRIRPHVTAPVAAPAQPAGLSTKQGAPPPAQSKVPGKSGAASPSSVSAKAAAAAPPAARPGASANPQRTIVEIDPNDRAASRARTSEKVARIFGKK